MKVVAITMVKDEIDFLPHSLEHMLSQVDHVYVADNLSADGTLDYLLDLHSRMAPWLTVIPDYEVAYTQSAKMSALADLARQEGADFIVPFDADEIWRGWRNGTIKNYLEQVLDEISDGDVYEAELHDHVVTGIDDPTDDNFVRRTHWRRSEPLRLPKVICRALPGLVIEQGNHAARYPGRHVQRGSGITVCHFPYRSTEQMERKIINGGKAYDAAVGRVPASAGQHWISYRDAYERSGRAAVEEIYNLWFHSDDPLNDERNVYEICTLNG